MTDLTENNAESLLDLNWEEAQDFELIPDGEEIKLRIYKAVLGQSRAGSPMLTVTFEDPSNDNVSLITEYMVLPSAESRESNPRAARFQMIRLGEFFECFSIPKGQGIDTETMVGAEGWVTVRQEDNEQVGRKVNRIGRYSRSA